MRQGGFSTFIIYTLLSHFCISKYDTAKKKKKNAHKETMESISVPLLSFINEHVLTFSEYSILNITYLPIVLLTVFSRNDGQKFKKRKKKFYRFFWPCIMHT